MYLAGMTHHMYMLARMGRRSGLTREAVASSFERFNEPSIAKDAIDKAFAVPAMEESAQSDDQDPPSAA